jgi:hypothetical protein
MLWIITKDLLSRQEGHDSSVNVFKSGPKTEEQYRVANAAGKAELIEKIINACNFNFRLYGDGELYYEGACLDLEDKSEEYAFEPLDWAAREAGCTRMDYLKKGCTGWKTL